MSSSEAPVPELASPLPYLIDEEARGDRQATEAVFLTFGVDLGFFEKTVLGVCRSAGARVTVVSDASMYAPDPRAATQAGITYVPGLAQIPGAFHPKLVLLVGPSRAVAGVGSGNMTLPGWQFNSEIWTIATARHGQVPLWLPSLADWLERLPTKVSIGSQAAQGIKRAAAQLKSLAPGLEHDGLSECRFVHNLDQPIIRQLPQEPMDELRLYAPFHDADGAAIRALIDRMKPAHTYLAIQPGKTVSSNHLLEDLQSENDLSVVCDALADRYRHGKLIEWRRGEERWSLTGSPNLSRPALLKTVAEGNCEIGLIARIEATLFPDGDRLKPEEIQEVTFPVLNRSPAPQESRATILEVLLTDGQTHVSLARAMKDYVQVEFSVYSEDPDNWTRLGTIPPGKKALSVDFPIPPGSRVRVWTSDSTATHLAFATNPASVLHRSGQGSGQGRKYYLPEKLLSDASHLQAFLQDVEELSAALAATKLPAVSTGNVPGDESGGPHEPTSWLDYLSQAADTYGQELTHYAYALPQVSALGLAADVEVDWVDRLADDTLAELEDDSAEVEVDLAEASEDVVSAEPPDFKSAQEAVRRRFQKWIGELVARLYRLGTAERLIGTRLVLHAVSGHLWNSDDQDWYETLVKAADSLADTPTQSRLRECFACLAGVALVVLEDATPIRPSTDRTIEFRRLTGRLLPLSTSLNQDLLERYVQDVLTIDGRFVTSDMVMELVQELENPDLLQNAISRLQEQGFDAHSHGANMIHIRGANAPWLASVTAIAMTESLCPVLAWCEDAKQKWELAVWSPPMLFRARGASGVEPATWDSFELPDLIDLRTLAEAIRQDQNKASDYRRSGLRHAVKEMPLEVARILTDLGLSQARPPTD